MDSKQQTLRSSNDSASMIFARHVANEVMLINNVGRRKRLQIEIQQLIINAQVEDGCI